MGCLTIHQDLVKRLSSICNHLVNSRLPFFDPLDGLINGEVNLIECK
jgi:hypothetical protein